MRKANIGISVLLIGSIFTPSVVEAKPQNQPHHCGIKVTGRLISDKPFGFPFGDACKIHDECLDSGNDRNMCRGLFKVALRDICNNIPDGKEKKLRFFTNGDRKSFCFKTASAYATAVGIWDISKE
jgi:hypothetical protein